jgi:hypothetical protein
MKRWIITMALFLISWGLANPAAFTTPGGHTAIALVLPDSTGIVLEDHAYTLALYFSAAGPLIMDLHTLAGLVDMVVDWADTRQVAAGYEGCTIGVFVGIASNGTIDQVSALDCAGKPVALLFLFHLPPLDYKMVAVA